MEQQKLIPASNVTASNVTAKTIAAAAKKYPTPFYLYDESLIRDRCKELRDMPNAFGLKVRYGMKANSSKALLKIIANEGLGIDAASLNEAKRAMMGGFGAEEILLTTQEVPIGEDRRDLEDMMKVGLNYNVCSLRQLELVADFAGKNKIPLSMRVHPGVGSGASSTRNTGDKYSCFGVHLSVVKEAMDIAKEKGLVFKRVHVHIGSGGDPNVWKDNIDRELFFLEQYFPGADTINFGGGFKEKRMPNEERADIKALGQYAKERIEGFFKRTGRKLFMEIEPGTFVVAMAGFLVTRVLDKKNTGSDGFQFLVVDGGMESNTRPLLYGARHPMFVVSTEGTLLSGEYGDGPAKKPFVVVGRCCESGDALTLDDEGKIVERNMAEPQFDDYLVLGGCGAYCSSMTPFNYNSHTQIPEVLQRANGDLVLIRKAQSLAQVTQNELSI